MSKNVTNSIIEGYNSNSKFSTYQMWRTFSYILLRCQKSWNQWKITGFSKSRARPKSLFPQHSNGHSKDTQIDYKLQHYLMGLRPNSKRTKITKKTYMRLKLRSLLFYYFTDHHMQLLIFKFTIQSILSQNLVENRPKSEESSEWFSYS